MTEHPWRDLVHFTDIDQFAIRLEQLEYWPVCSVCGGLVKEELAQAVRKGVLTNRECMVLIAIMHGVRAKQIAPMMGITERGVNIAYKRACKAINEWRDCGVTTALLEAFGRGALEIIE